MLRVKSKYQTSAEQEPVCFQLIDGLISYQE